MPGEQALSHDVKVLSAVSLAQDTASEMLHPILPLFVTRVLGAAPATIGLIEGVAEATAAITKVVAGDLADRRPRKPLILFGYSLSGLSKPLIGLATGWPLVLFARFADRFGKGVRGAPRDALIASDTPPHLRGRAFGFHRAMDTTGAVIGPLLGLLAYHLLGEELRPLFLLAAIPAAISVALVLLVREQHPPARRARPAPHERTPLGRRYWTAMALLGAFAVVNFTDALVLLRASELGLGVGGVIGAYVLYNVVYAALSYPAGAVSDRMPRPLVMAGGVTVFAVAYTGLGLAESSSAVWVLLPLYGAFTALTDGVGKAWLADLLPPDAVGRGLGVQQAVVGVGALVAGVWAGLAWGEAGELPLVVSGVAAGLLVVPLAVVGPRLSP